MQSKEDKIRKNREKIMFTDEVISEFRYRQIIALTGFEVLCSKKTSKIRENVVNAFEYHGDEMTEHGYYSHYTSHLNFFLPEQLKISYTLAEAVILSYYFALPAEREKFKRHLIAGVAEERPELFRLKPNPKYEHHTTEDLGKIILNIADLNTKSVFNIPYQLSRQPKEEKETIKNILTSAIKQTQQDGLDQAIENLTHNLLPYFFKEAKPHLKNRSELATFVSFFARPEKYYRIERNLNVFGWLFLTQHEWEQERTINNLYPEKNKMRKQFLRKISNSLCHC